MRNTSQVCPYCRGLLAIPAESKSCSDCGTSHHSVCWAEYGHCTVFGCPGTATESRRNRLLFLPAILWSLCALHSAVAAFFSFLLVPAISYCMLASMYYGWDLIQNSVILHRNIRGAARHDLLYLTVNVFPMVLVYLIRSL